MTKDEAVEIILELLEVWVDTDFLNEEQLEAMEYAKYNLT